MAIDEKLNQILQIKSDIKNAIIEKGVEVDSSLPFSLYPSKIREISGGEIPQNVNYIHGDGRSVVFKSDRLISMLTSQTNVQSSMIKPSSTTEEFSLPKTVEHYEFSIT